MAKEFRTPDRFNRDRIKSNMNKLPRGTVHRPAAQSQASTPMTEHSDAESFHASAASLSSVLTPTDAKTEAPGRRHRRLGLPKSWQFWSITLILLFGGLSALSATALLRLPSLPNCPAIFWPTASASLRLYCAQIAAEKRTAKDLLRAISLIDGLPEDHPLRPEADRNIELWAKEILSLGEEVFQQGELNKAISTARKIPTDTTAYQQVEDKIASWEAIWQKAENLYRQAEEELKQENLRQAFRLATQLLGVGNRYWENEKYRELNSLIARTREDSNKISKAKGLADQGGLTNFLAAIKLIEEIQPKSLLYAKAQGIISDFGRDMLDLAEAALDRRDYNQALKITRQIPEKANLKEEVRDFEVIAEAQSQAWGGTSDDLEAAIVNVQRIKQDRPLYGKAQQLISSWQLEIQDVAILNRAQQLAQPGTTGDLRAAIAEVQRISFGNPRRAEAEKTINQWQRQIETSEDQPYLDRAEQLASAGDVGALQSAISEAGNIRPGRTLYDQASSRIDQWTQQIQRSQDQPQLDRARQLANTGDLEGAIAAARQVGSERSLYDEAQAAIRDWSSELEQTQDQPLLAQARQLAQSGNVSEAIAVAQRIGPDRSLFDAAQADIQQWRGQFQGQDQMRQAYNAASIGTPTMLAAAIEIANQVPTDNLSRSEADRMIDQWSNQMLQMAESQAGFNLAVAIEIAAQVPANTKAYGRAQRDIQTWRQLQR